MPKTKLNIALEYRNKFGWSVIPLKPQSKTPLIKWEEFQRRLATKEEIKKWFLENPEANIGIVTGKISQLVVVDIEKDGSVGGYPATLMCKTGGGGWHFYYKYPHGKIFQSRNRIGELTDLKAEGGYVVAPPSVHSSGIEYEWAVDPLNVDLIEIPDGLFSDDTQSNMRSAKSLKKIEEGVIEGERNDAATAYAGHLLARAKRDRWESEVWPKLAEWNRKNKPPLEEKELRSVYESIAKKEEGKKEAEDKEDENVRQIDLLKGIICSDSKIEVFLDQLDEAYVNVEMKDHRENMRCHSERFKSWLIKKFWDKHNEVPNSENLNKVISLLQAEATFSGNRHELWSRIAAKDGVIWYDLANDKWQAVRIDENGWEIVDDVPILFKRYFVQNEQDAPERGGDAKNLLNFVPIRGSKQQLLFLVSTIVNFFPHIARAIQMYKGPQGSAKSTTARMEKNLIDPSKMELITLHKEIRELAQQLDQHYLLPFDNITSLNSSSSDALCRAITGGGFSKRKLYTDADNIIFTFKRAIILNGINTVGNKPDLLDRSIIFNLDRIEEKDRKPEEDFWKEFGRQKSKILGGMFDVLSEALKILPVVKIDRLPRMADFARCGSAIAQALGYSQEEFLEAYNENLGWQNEHAIEESPVASTIMILANEIISEWEGTSSELLRELKRIAGTEGIEVSAKTFPKSPSALSRRINEVKVNLLAKGIEVEKMSQREWRIRNVEKCRECRDAVNEALDKGNITDGVDNGNDIDVAKLPF
jgi:hypothetical protein